MSAKIIFAALPSLGLCRGAAVLLKGEVAATRGLK